MGLECESKENGNNQQDETAETDHYADDRIFRERKRKEAGGKQDRKRSDNRFHETGI